LAGTPPLAVIEQPPAGGDASTPHAAVPSRGGSAADDHPLELADRLIADSGIQGYGLLYRENMAVYLYYVTLYVGASQPL